MKALSELVASETLINRVKRVCTVKKTLRLARQKLAQNEASH